MATSIEYVELLGRSNFSFLQGASHPEEMVLHAKALGYRGLALCDLNGLYGVVKGYEAAHKTVSFSKSELFARAAANPEFSYHVGAELSLVDKSSLILLPTSKDGYAHLSQLITLAKRKAPKGFSDLTLSEILVHSDDLIACPLPPWNSKTLKSLREIFHRRLYLPVWKDFSWSSVQHFQQALQLEQQLGLRLFVTQRPFMHHPDRKPLHDVLTCIFHKTHLSAAKSLLLSNRERHLKPLHDLAYLWRERPDLIERTMEISEQLQFSLSELRYKYPSSHLPPGQLACDYLRERVEVGLRWRYPQGEPAPVRQLIEHEIEVITDLQYEDYFLTIYDICEFARERGILFQGRGSAANSVVCYALGLTSVDPTQIQLLFERFISKERGEPPDIDVDFESGRREEVIQYIYQKYGADFAAMVSTVICYRTRMALRETAKVLEVPQPAINHLVKFMGREGLVRLIENPAKASELGIKPERFRLLMEISASLQGFPRHLGIHTGGFLVSQRPIAECVPIEKASMEKRAVVQWNKDDINTLKMMKIDVLGLGMLTAVQKSFALLRQHKALDLSLSTLPPHDAPTYEMIQKADTVGVFQIESRAQMSLLPRLRPQSFYDLVVSVAIIRPGPIQGGMVHPFLRRRNGVEAVSYPHPDLEPILNKTLGVPIFQEQIMQIASTVCGFTPGESDELRRVMSSSWKQAEVMQGLRERLLNGMLSHGLNLKSAEQIYRTIEGFAAYGFPESHAASFALITYASCFLKQHHPDVFVCSLLNSQPMGFYSPRTLIADAQRHQVAFLPLDIQKSEFDYTLEPTDASAGQSRLAVRLGFRSIFGVQERHLQHLIAERTQNGPYHDLEDLIRRTQLPRHLLVSLAAAGGFSSFGFTPRSALWTLQSLQLDQRSLMFGRPRETFQAAAQDLAALPGIELIPQESDWEVLQREYQTKGFALDHHPLSLLRPSIEQTNQTLHQQNYVPYVQAKDLPQQRHGNKVRVAGLLSIQQRPPTAKGFAFLTLEDETGFFNIVMTPAIYQAYRLVLLQSPLLEVQGALEKHEGVLNIKALKLCPLPLKRWLEADSLRSLP
ncbi:MAG: error-prone DNA polymerase [Bdellovibrionales bacterium]|nr:error-prone DNA polymerase [Bdellovibrionales bacterium]